MLRQRSRPAGAAAERCGRAAASHLAHSPELARAWRVALFASLSDEIPTRPLYELVRRLGRTALFPRIVRESDPRSGASGRPFKLEFVPLARWEDLRPGPLGIREPLAGPAEPPLHADDLVLVPGLGFDRRGRRLGRGGGFYDRRFPPGEPAPTLLGFVFSAQLVDEVPTGAHDRWMDGILTEQGLLRVARRLEDGDGS